MFDFVENTKQKKPLDEEPLQRVSDSLRKLVKLILTFNPDERMPLGDILNYDFNAIDDCEKTRIRSKYVRSRGRQPKRKRATFKEYRPQDEDK